MKACLFYPPARHRGFTIAELLVALVLGLVVTLAAGGMLVTANASFTAQTEAAQVDAAGRLALDAIERAARQVAFVDWDRDDAAADMQAEPARIAGLDARSLSKATAGIGNPRAGSVGGSDVLALRFAGAGAGPEGDGSMIGCAGFGVGQGREGWSIFYVAPNADGVAELRCKYRGDAHWSADALVAGVDSFQVLYGLDTDVPRDGLANRYVNAGAIDALDAALALEGETDAARAQDFLRRTHWKRVASIKVGLLLHGAKRARVGSGAAVYELFGAGYGAEAGAGGADAGTRVLESDMPAALRERQRHAFGATILLRNAAM